MAVSRAPQVVRLAIDYRPALLSRAGIGRYTRELVRALAARGDVELHLYAHGVHRAGAGCTPPAAARLHRLPIPGRALPLLRRLGVGADRLAGSPALFHWTDYVHPPLRRARAVVTVHDLAFAADRTVHGGRQSDVLLARTGAAVRAAARVIVPSHATAAAVRAHLGVGGERITVAPLGADHVPLAPPGGPPLGGQPYVLAVGTLQPRKGHDVLLRAWRRLPAPRPRLVCIGRRGWLCAGLAAELEAAAADGVLWCDDVADAELWRWLRHARVLAYPSRDEGFGLPPLEAMRLGVPVVAGDCAALRETIGTAASLCPASDAAALASALAELAADSARRRERIAAGRAHAAAYTWSACAAAHVDAYRQALAP